MYIWHADTYCDSCGEKQKEEMIEAEKSKILAETLPPAEEALQQAISASKAAVYADEQFRLLPFPPEGAPDDGWWKHNQQLYLLSRDREAARVAETEAYAARDEVQEEAEEQALKNLDNGASDGLPQEARDDDFESDSPTHCGSNEECLEREQVGYGDDGYVGTLLGQLTAEGRQYVCEALAEGPRGEDHHNGVAKMWARHWNVECGTNTNAAADGDVLAEGYGVEQSSMESAVGMQLTAIPKFSVPLPDGENRLTPHYVSDEWPEWLEGRDSNLMAVVAAIEADYADEDDGYSLERKTVFGYALAPFVAQRLSDVVLNAAGNTQPIPVRDNDGKLWLILGVEFEGDREIECPLMHREDEDGHEVNKVEPGDADRHNDCVYCTEKIGDKHGYASPNMSAIYLCSAPELWLVRNSYGESMNRFSIIEMDDGKLVARPNGAFEVVFNSANYTGRKIAIGPGLIPGAAIAKRSDFGMEKERVENARLTLLPISTATLLATNGNLVQLTVRLPTGSSRLDRQAAYIIYNTETKGLYWSSTSGGEAGLAPLAFADDGYALRFMQIELDRPGEPHAPKPSAKDRRKPEQLVDRLVGKRLRIGAGWVWRTSTVANALLPPDRRDRAPNAWNRYKLESAVDVTIVAVVPGGSYNRYNVVVRTADGSIMPLVLAWMGRSPFTTEIEVPLRPDTTEAQPSEPKPKLETKLLLKHVEKRGKRQIELEGLSGLSSGANIPCPIERGARIITGDCAGNCLRTLWKNYDGSWQLVHGVVEGAGSLRGRRIFHAWLEREVELEVGGHKTHVDMVYDPTYDRWLLKALYYRIAKPSLTHSYTGQQATQLATKTGHCGPWDDAIWKAGEGTGKKAASKAAKKQKRS